MAIGVPAEEVVNIFNPLVRTSPADVVEVARAEWRLRALARSRPGDVLVEVALLYAVLLLGKASEGVLLADRLWQRRKMMGIEQLGTFLFELAHLGYYQKAASLLDELRDSEVSLHVTSVDDIAIEVAWGLGNIDRLSAAVANGLAGGKENWQAFIADLKNKNLERLLPVRQKVVQEKSLGRQCFSQILLTPGTEGPWSLTHYIYSSGTYEDRLTLEDQIHEAINDKLAHLDIPDAHWATIAELIVPITAAPPWHKDSFAGAS